MTVWHELELAKGASRGQVMTAAVNASLQHEFVQVMYSQRCGWRVFVSMRLDDGVETEPVARHRCGCGHVSFLTTRELRRLLAQCETGGECEI